MPPFPGAETKVLAVSGRPWPFQHPTGRHAVDIDDSGGISSSRPRPWGGARRDHQRRSVPATRPHPWRDIRGAGGQAHYGCNPPPPMGRRSRGGWGSGEMAGSRRRADAIRREPPALRCSLPRPYRRNPPSGPARWSAERGRPRNPALPARERSRRFSGPRHVRVSGAPARRPPFPSPQALLPEALPSPSPCDFSRYGLCFSPCMLSGREWRNW